MWLLFPAPASGQDTPVLKYACHGDVCEADYQGPYDVANCDGHCGNRFSCTDHHCEARPDGLYPGYFSCKEHCHPPQHAVFTCRNDKCVTAIGVGEYLALHKCQEKCHFKPLNERDDDCAGEESGDGTDGGWFSRAPNGDCVYNKPLIPSLNTGNTPGEGDGNDTDCVGEESGDGTDGGSFSRSPNGDCIYNEPKITDVPTASPKIPAIPSLNTAIPLVPDIPSLNAAKPLIPSSGDSSDASKEESVIGELGDVGAIVSPDREGLIPSPDREALIPDRERFTPSPIREIVVVAPNREGGIVLTDRDDGKTNGGSIDGGGRETNGAVNGDNRAPNALRAPKVGAVPPDKGGLDEHLSMIVGISGALLVLIVVAVVICCCCMKRKTMGAETPERQPLNGRPSPIFVTRPGQGLPVQELMGTPRLLAGTPRSQIGSQIGTPRTLPGTPSLGVVVPTTPTMPMQGLQWA